MIAALLLLLYLPACNSWHVSTSSPAQFVADEHPREVRATLTDGSTLVLKAPSIRGDTLFGTIVPDYGVRDTVRRSVLPLDGVRNVAVRKFSAGTTVLMVGLVAGTLAIAFFISEGSHTSSRWF